jgi:signal transduction histidine kinase
MNLLGNALKFTEVGCIVISVRSNAVEGDKVPLEIKINDTGIGMSKDFLFNEAFEPFRKRDQHSAGTGVGLNVVSTALAYGLRVQQVLILYSKSRSDASSRTLAVPSRSTANRK